MKKSDKIMGDLTLSAIKRRGMHEKIFFFSYIRRKRLVLVEYGFYFAKNGVPHGFFVANCPRLVL